VFTTEIGTPIEPDNLRRVWYPLREAAGLGDLRHSCVTLLLTLGPGCGPSGVVGGS
jgi:hypothetical protein